MCHSTIDAAFMNRKVKSFKQTEYLLEQCGALFQKLQQMFKVQSFGLDTVHNRFATCLLP